MTRPIGVWRERAEGNFFFTFIVFFAFVDSRAVAFQNPPDNRTFVDVLIAPSLSTFDCEFTIDDVLMVHSLSTFDCGFTIDF